MGIFVQAVASCQSLAEKRNLEVHTGQNTLPGMDRPCPLFSDGINTHASVDFLYSGVRLLSLLATN